MSIDGQKKKKKHRLIDKPSLSTRLSFSRLRELLQMKYYICIVLTYYIKAKIHYGPPPKNPQDLGSFPFFLSYYSMDSLADLEIVERDQTADISGRER